MLPEHRKHLNTVRRELLTQLGDRDTTRVGYHVRAAIELSEHQIRGRPPDNPP
jgi:hypothetical protein